MAIDLQDERVAFVETLPVRGGQGLDLSCHLTTDGRGRLGVVCSFHETKRASTLNGSKTEVDNVVFDPVIFTHAFCS